MEERTLRVLEFDKIVKKLITSTVSDLGREIAEVLLPETNYLKVNELLNETSDGVSFIVRKGSPPMGGIHDIRGSLKRVDIGAVLNPGELLRVGDTLRAARNLKNYANDNVINENNSVNGLISSLVPNKRIEEKIEGCIISEEEISDNASPTLSNIRRQIRDAQNSIKDKLNSIVKSSTYQKFMQEAIVTIRGDRYVIPVKQEMRSEIPGLIHDSSASGATIYVEPLAVVEANNNIKQFRIKEQLEIERILQELTNDICGIIENLKSNMSILARLDFIFAKAKLSLDYNCVLPRVNSDGRVIIKKGRHPLIEQKKVVPIDFWIGNEFRTLIITGPNTGGKTVSLKTVGLFTLMAQAGLHIPANEGTEISIFNKIFADIGDEQSIEQSLSTFSSHMKNIVYILENIDDKSLVLFDELGAGTDPLEGSALAMSILEHTRESGAVSVATTHYSELKVYAISTKGVENASCEFDVETLRPTYKLLIGVPGKSNAFAISNRLGLSEDVLFLARKFLSKEDIEFEDILMDIEKNRSETEKEKLRAERYRIEIENMKKEMEEQKAKISLQRDNAIKEAKVEAKRILFNAKTECEEILTQMRRLEKERETSDRNKEVEQIRLKLKNKIDNLEDSMAEALMPKNGLVKPPKNLKPGDSVLVVNLNQKGSVIAPPNKDDEAIIQVGIMKINVHVSNLKLLNEQKDTVQKIVTGRSGNNKAKTITTELDLRGFNLDVATESVDKFLDDASIAGLHEVSIIHGKGTGVLRSGIQQFLKTHYHVKSFRLGKYGEGESGVTVVELK